MVGLAAARGCTGRQKPKLGPGQVNLAEEMYDETGPDGKLWYTIEIASRDVGAPAIVGGEAATPSVALACSPCPMPACLRIGSQLLQHGLFGRRGRTRRGPAETSLTEPLRLDRVASNEGQPWPGVSSLVVQ